MSVQPELDGFHEPVGTIEDAIFRCKKDDMFRGGGRASDQAWDLFLDYHRSRPEIFTAFRKYTLEIIKGGAKKLGAKTIAEKLRWESIMRTDGTDYKISNTATSFYSRLFMEFHAEHQGFFDINHNRPLTGLVKTKAEVEGV